MKKILEVVYLIDAQKARPWVTLPEDVRALFELEDKDKLFLDIEDEEGNHLFGGEVSLTSGHEIQFKQSSSFKPAAGQRLRVRITRFYRSSHNLANFSDG